MMPNEFAQSYPGVRAVTFTAGTLTCFLVALWMNPIEYGMMAVASFFAYAVTFIAQAGFARAMSRSETPISERDYASAFFWQVGLASGLSTILFWKAEAFSALFSDYSGMTELIRWFSFLPILECLASIPLVKISRGHRSERLGFFFLVWSIAEWTLLIYFLAEDQKAYAFVYSRLLGSFLRVSTLWFIVRWNPFHALGVLFSKGAETQVFGRAFRAQLESAPQLLIAGLVPLVGGKLYYMSELGMLSWALHLSGYLGRALVAPGSPIRVSDPELGNQRAESFWIACNVLGLMPMAVVAAVMPELSRQLFASTWLNASPYFALWSLVTIVAAAAVVLMGAEWNGVEVSGGRRAWIWKWGSGLAVVIAGWAGGVSNGPRGFIAGCGVAAVLPLIFLIKKAGREGQRSLVASLAIPFLITALTGVATFNLKRVLPPPAEWVYALTFTMVLMGVVVQGLAFPTGLRGLLRTVVKVAFPKI